MNPPVVARRVHRSIFITGELSRSKGVEGALSVMGDRICREERQIDIVVLG